MDDIPDLQSELKSFLDKDDSEILDDDIDRIYNMLNTKDALNNLRSLGDDDELLSSISDEENEPEDLPAEDLPTEDLSAKNLPAKDTTGNYLEPDIMPENLLSKEQAEKMESLLTESMPLGAPVPSNEISDDYIDKMLQKANEVQNAIGDLSEDYDPLIQNYSMYDGLTEEERAARDARTKELESKVRTGKRSEVNKTSIISKIIKALTERVKTNFSNYRTKSQKIPVLFLLIPLGILSLAVVILTVLIIVQKVKINNILEERGTIVVEKPNYRSNISNFIFVSSSQPFENGSIELVKMLLDSEASKFYFNRYFDIRQYDISLTDINEKLYNMDLTSIFSEEETLQNNYSSTILTFDPVDEGIKEIILTLRNISTNFKTTFRLSLSKKVENGLARYLTQPFEVDIGDPHATLSIEDATFASSGSRINYKISLNSDNNLIHFPKETPGLIKPITLEENGRNILAQRSRPIEYGFDNNKIILGRMDFDNVTDLNNTVKLRFNGLFKQIKIDDEFITTPLFQDTIETQISINVRPYKLVLERMGAIDDMYILVYHVEDLRIKEDLDENSDEDSDTQNDEEPMQLGANRVETKINAQLIARSESGMDIVLDGVCRSKREGGDITFSTKNVAGIINNLSTDTLYLRINDLSISMDNIEVPINLLTQNTNKYESDIAQGNKIIESSFIDRLGVKSYTVNVLNLEGLFDPSVLNDPLLSSEYAPIKTDTPAHYNARVLTSGLSDNGNKLYAVVQETWKGMISGEEASFYRTHKVIAEKTENSWIIKEDTIIK